MTLANVRTSEHNSGLTPNYALLSQVFLNRSWPKIHSLSNQIRVTKLPV